MFLVEFLLKAKLRGAKQYWAMTIVRAAKNNDRQIQEGHRNASFSARSIPL